MNATFEQLKNDVLDKKLCTHCGTCVGICPVGALEINDILGECEPHLVDKCIECGLCIETCPGKEVNFSSLEIKETNLSKHPLLGQFWKIFIAHSNDEEIRRRGASGGMATAILLHLFDEQEVDGAVVLDFSTTKPWFPEVRIANNREKIIQAAQSKYFIYPQNKILKVLRESSIKKVAYFGLPCQVHGIKKAILKKVPGTEKIKYILGCYCGNNLYYDGTLSLFQRFGFDDLKQVKRIAYREGEYPGNFVVEGKDGSKGIVDKFTFNYLSFFYTPFRCLSCVDLTNELADLSVGDGWQGLAKESGEGQSVVIIRNKELARCLNEGAKLGKFYLREIAIKEAIRMHSNVLNNKKVGAFARMVILKKCGYCIPEYFLTMPVVTIKRYFFESINLVVLYIGWTRIARKLINMVPLFILKKMMHYIRGKWREKTR